MANTATLNGDHTTAVELYLIATNLNPGINSQRYVISKHYYVQ